MQDHCPRVGDSSDGGRDRHGRGTGACGTRGQCARDGNIIDAFLGVSINVCLTVIVFVNIGWSAVLRSLTSSVVPDFVE